VTDPATIVAHTQSCVRVDNNGIACTPDWCSSDAYYFCPCEVVVVYLEHVCRLRCVRHPSIAFIDLARAHTMLECYLKRAGCACGAVCVLDLASLLLSMRGGGGLARTRVSSSSWCQGSIDCLHRPGPRAYSAQVFIDSLVRRRGDSECRQQNSTVSSY
jgi:hypothetical protein